MGYLGLNEVAPRIYEGRLDLPKGSLSSLWNTQKIDIVIGHPTFGNADNIGQQLESGLRGALEHFPEKRVAFIVSDGTRNHSSDDSSCIDAVIETARSVLDTFSNEERSRVLVTATPYDGYQKDRTPGKGSALKLIFEEMAGTCVQTLILLDGDLRNDMAQWQSVFSKVISEHESKFPDQEYFITAKYARHFVDASLTRFIVGPLTTLMRQFVPGGISGDIVLSAGAVAHEREAQWNEMRRRYGTDISTTFDNIADKKTLIYEVYLGAKLHDITDEGKLSVMPGEVIGAALERILHYEQANGQIESLIKDTEAELVPLIRWDASKTGIDFIDPGYTSVFDVDVKIATLVDKFAAFRDDLLKILGSKGFARLEEKWKALSKLKKLNEGPLRFLDVDSNTWISMLHRAVAFVLATRNIDIAKRALNYLYTAAFLEFCKEKLLDLGLESLSSVRKAQKQLGVPSDKARSFYETKVDATVEAMSQHFFERRKCILELKKEFL